MTADAAALRSVRRRYFALLALRWLPVGLVIPVSVLLVTSRGLSLAQFGTVAAAQGFVVLALELPTGGLADAIGRRPVLLAATLIDAAALAVFLGADTMAVLLGVFAAKGVSRALDSGPLDAWLVDAVLADDDAADLETILAHGSAVLCGAIAAGAVASGLLVAASDGGTDALTVPVAAAVVVDLLAVAAIARWMTEHRPLAHRSALLANVAAVPATIRAALAMVRGSVALRALVVIEALWCFGMAAFEILMAPRLEQLVGGADRASAIQGPVVAIAWIASALGAFAIPRLVRRTGAPAAGALLRLAQGAAVLAMAVAGGPVVLVAAFTASYAVHGASNPVHQGLLHRQVTGPQRVTVLSVNSMLGMPAAAIGGIALGWLADAAGIPAAMALGALVLAAAAPLYLLTRPPRAQARADTIRELDASMS